MSWDFINAAFQGKPELVQAVQSVQHSRKGGFLYETDLSHLPQHLQTHISQIKDLTNRLLTVASDENIDDHLRQESREVLEQVLHHLSISHEQLRAVHTEADTSQMLDREIEHIVSTAQDILEQMRSPERPRQKRLRESETVSEPASEPQKRGKSEQDLKRFTRACEKLTTEYSLHKSNIPLGTAREYLDSQIFKTINRIRITI